ncbi:hypothetical protein BCR43DRAFT_490640 [Syncephalastrum racemosum]|uniref:FAR-17a/AIG1-like protein-domain-containing protein n=1 Tax=Syncephalastrum racemosum TaxID=13706 RepID=A0A1X2HGE5_SYNRA|nr:hypothetical protein BCR43DRAFT_490640 [Syncephalastrum racemosum]
MPYNDERLPPSSSAVIRWFRLDNFEPERAVTSYWVSSKIFLAIRIPLVLYSTVIMWTSIATSAIEGSMRSYFIYFTHLTYIGLHAYLVTAVYHHVCYLLHKDLRSFFKQPAALNYLYVYLYHTVLVFNIITPIVYWSALSADALNVHNTPTLEWWLNTSLHGVSWFLMFTDSCFNRMKMRVNIVVLIVITIIFYMFLTFIGWGSLHWWVYPFLAWSQGGVAAGWYVGVGVCFVIVYFLQYLFHFVRDWIAKKMGREHGRPQDRSPQPAAVDPEMSRVSSSPQQQ